MPLKLWLPLDGTVENRGASGVTMSGSPASWGNGRTGKCAIFNNNTGNCIANSTTEFNYTVEDFSWCMWLKKDFASKTANAMYAFTVGRADAGGYGYGLGVLSSAQIIFRFGTSSWAIDCPDNEWHHFAFTRKGTAIKIYRDGALITSATFGGTLPTYSDGNGPGVGCFHYTGNIYPLIGAISDFRIYNHTLSAKEVYELSRALIVHYPLSAPGNAQANLLTWTKNYTEANPLVHTSSAKDGYKYLGNDTLIKVTPGKTYYVQVKCDGTLSSYHASGAGVVSDRFTLWFYIRNIGTSKGIGSYDQTTCFTSASTGILVNDPGRQLYVWKWTAPSNAQDITLRTNSYSDGTTAVTLKFWDFKIEEGTYTSYVPSKNSAQYGELGYGTGTVRDATGRGIDLSYSSASPEFITGSPRYAAALNFNQQTYAYRDTFGYVLPNITLAFWFRPISNDNAEHFLFGLFSTWRSNGTGMYHRVNTSVYPLQFKSDAESADKMIEHTYTLNAWQHVAIVYDGTTIKYYVNAVLAHSITYGSNGTCTLGNIYLGNSMYNTHPASETDDSAMSDFRLYGTALTADDVKYLYETSAAIDNNGDMFADSFEETEMLPRVGKEGLVYGSHLSESGGTQRLFNNYTDMIPVDSNHSTKTFTPTTATNSTVAWYYFECIPGMRKYHITMVLEWGGFENITTDKPDFGAWFQGTARKTDKSGNEWNAGSFTAALNNHKQPGTLAKANASGVYLYDIDFEMSSHYTDEYIGQHLGLRSDYSNGTGWFRISKVRIYPADEHMVDTASLCSSGAIQVRLADEAGLA